MCTGTRRKESKAGVMSSPKVMIGVMFGMVIAGLPLLNKTVYEREQNVHRMRDDQYDLKDSARSSRLSRKTTQS